jgi:ribosomal-protein-alanine N-acetyltransferase
MFAYAQDELVARPGMWEPYSSFEECESHVDQLIREYESGLMWWALVLIEDDRLIGRVQLSDWSRSNSRAELSYALDRSYWGRGLMTEAVIAAANFGWTSMELHRLEATVLPDNQASIRLLSTLGMKREGRLRHYRRLWGDWVDVDIYGMLRPGFNG